MFYVYSYSDVCHAEQFVYIFNNHLYQKGRGHKYVYELISIFRNPPGSNLTQCKGVISLK